MSVQLTDPQGETLHELFASGWGSPDGGGFTLAEPFPGTGLRDNAARRCLAQLVARRLIRKADSGRWSPERGMEPCYEVTQQAREAYQDWYDRRGEEVLP